MILLNFNPESPNYGSQISLYAFDLQKRPIGGQPLSESSNDESFCVVLCIRFHFRAARAARPLAHAKLSFCDRNKLAVTRGL